MPIFVSLSSYTIKDRGTVYTVYLDKTVSNFSHLIGQSVVIDGTVFTCKAVERFLHCPPWYEGELVGLLVG